MNDIYEFFQCKFLTAKKNKSHTKVRANMTQLANHWKLFAISFASAFFTISLASSIYAWSKKQKKKDSIITISGVNSCVLGSRACVFSPNNKLIATIVDANCIKLWDALSGNLLHTFESKRNINMICFLSNKQIICVTQRRYVQIYNFESKFHSSTTHFSLPYDCPMINSDSGFVCPKRSLFVYKSDFTKLTVFDLQKKQVVKTFDTGDYFLDACMSPDERLVACYTFTEHMLLFDLVTMKQIENNLAYLPEPDEFRFIENNKIFFLVEKRRICFIMTLKKEKLIVSSRWRDTREFSKKYHTIIKRFEKNHIFVSSRYVTCFSEQSQLVAVKRDNCVEIYDFKCNFLHFFDLDSSLSFRWIKFSDDGCTLVVGSNSSKICLFSLHEIVMPAALRKSIICLVQSPHLSLQTIQKIVKQTLLQKKQIQCVSDKKLLEYIASCRKFMVERSKFEQRQA